MNRYHVMLHVRLEVEAETPREASLEAQLQIAEVLTPVSLRIVRVDEVAE